ncbi:uncharacterized protein LOC125837495 [Solanum verrucosum]|uniref:uncharacterized protein LOC125837495 n=1 Tax=Solanum verrucosum TaxID=315347 RepID=UPI0020D168B8|nr:uncharacterized protein LOC125837495 [Solanum verrucosum]
MTTRRASRRNEEENVGQEAPAPLQALIDPLAENITNAEFRSTFQVLDQAMTAQANRELVIPVNPNMVEEDPQAFINEVYKILAIMGVTPVEKAKLATYQVKGVAQIWFNQWKKARPVEAGLIEWERSGGWGCSRFRQKFSGQGYSNAPPRPNNERVSNPKPQGDGNRSSMPTCAKCGRNHEGNCLAGYNVCFGCGKMDHKIRNCPLVDKNDGYGRRRAQLYPSSDPSGSGANAPKQNRFYALQTEGVTTLKIK